MTSVLIRFAYRINAALERHLPEQRLFLKSDTETRFIRLRPATQAIALTGGTFLLAWTLVATAVMLMESIGAGSSREQALMQQGLYEQRLNALSNDRDLRAEEAVRAQERFNLALDQVSDMQARLLASEDSRRELETGIDVIQNTLRRTIQERDLARGDAQQATLALAQQGGTSGTELGHARDTVATLQFLTDALGTAAKDRDLQELAAAAAHQAIVDLEIARRGQELRNDAIFAKLEEAVTISIDPLDKMFRDAGMSPDDLLKQVRKGYSGQGGPLSPIGLSTSGPAPSADEIRANAILTGLDRMNLYRIAAFKSPFAMPIKSAFRFTSGFGFRRDPKGAGTRMHDGTDFAASYGTPVYATADGTIAYADWDSGYGRLIKIQHDYGIETRYAHLSQIRVEVGQRVSRGDRIGDMGNSGRSTGTHLHYEIRFGAKSVNPMTFIKAARDVF